MNNNEKCCGTCRYNKPSWETGKLTGYSCDNDESDYYGVSTFYNDSCEEYEEK